MNASLQVNSRPQAVVLHATEDMDSLTQCESASPALRAHMKPEDLVVSLGNSYIQSTAQLVVTREIAQVLIALTPQEQRTQAEALFKERMERILALGDDCPMPKAFQDELLVEVRKCLNALR
ncbi:hypothetical protein AWB80_06733 [Caballeronia pedi]|uniref:Uncharacterized protein n=1 Tax=Caballeronia pedi TaxID=1777141 RepID=A0A158DE50_9BURK|nr:hypothetical protein [Caballeronia pedi]SAK92902.1 hypothetical protein AWB80_06733 [Caballeronia pedi]